MNNNDKVKFADAVIAALKTFNTAREDIPVACGILNRCYGLHGFKVAKPGTIVFSYKGHLVLYLESIDGRTVASIPFYYDSFKNCVDFADGIIHQEN